MGWWDSFRVENLRDPTNGRAYFVRPLVAAKMLLHHHQQKQQQQHRSSICCRCRRRRQLQRSVNQK